MSNQRHASKVELAVIQILRVLRRGWIPIFAVVSLLGTHAPIAEGQTYLQDVSPQFSTNIPVENGYIDASKGRLHLEVPMGSYPQRAGRPNNIALVYDSAIWTHANTTIWQPTNVGTGGWRRSTSWDQMSINYTDTESGNCDSGGPHFYYHSNWTATAPDGTVHAFFGETREDVCFFTSNIPTLTAYATDASGYYLTVTNYVAAVLYAPDGSSMPYFNGLKDSNGNYVNSTDTVGRTPVSTVVNGSTTTYTLPNAQGNTARVHTVTTATISLKTNFGQTGVTECTGPSCTVTVIQSIKLPDNNMYSFKYDCDSTVNSTACSSPSGQSTYYGLLTSMTLPTGTAGTITYAWQPFTDAQGNHYQWISKRTTTDSATGWSYTPSVVTTCATGQNNCQQTLTVQKPSGDKTVYTFCQLRLKIPLCTG